MAKNAGRIVDAGRNKRVGAHGVRPVADGTVQSSEPA